MAFHQPTRQSAQRVFRPAPDEDEAYAPAVASQAVEDSQTWVLFSPATDAGTSTSYLTSSHKSNITPGRSRISDLGSLNTLVRSEASTGQHRSESLLEAEDDDDAEEDDAELDSLDSHLPEFRSMPDFNTPAHPGATPVVPTHDGLGSFRVDHEAMGPDVQDRLFAFEQYNPHRVQRRRESMDRAQAELEYEEAHAMEKIQRIENWRLEQSRYLLDEIQKETRRRRRSIASMASTHPAAQKSDFATSLAPEIESHGDEDIEANEEWHEQSASDFGSDRESAWGRVTRKVIQDLLGIDDKMLSILFGESLPEDEDELSSTPKASAMHSSKQEQQPTDNAPESGWQVRMLERVARELGLLVHRLSEHPGAFSTFTRVQQMPLPYAGLPVIPETLNDPVPSTATAEDSVSRLPKFKPTIGTQTKPINVPQRRLSHGSTQSGPHLQGDNSNATFTQEEWEQDLDIRLVFRYLRSRFMSRSTSTGGHSANSHLSSLSTQDIAAKTARIRQHHPLVSRSRPVERRAFKATSPSSPSLFRPASSCASQSTRKSVRRSSCSSRHYWDIGGSVGTGSMVATSGPMGSWGEV